MEAAEPDRQELGREADAEVQRLRAELTHALLAAQKLEGDERGEAVKRTQAVRDELGAWLMLQRVDEQEVRIRRREDARERPVPTGLPTFAASTLTPAPRLFLRRFNQHLDAAGMSNERRGRILVTRIQGGPEEWAARELVGVDWGDVQRRFLERFQSPQHLQLLLRRLATCGQADGESVADFGVRLQGISIELDDAVTNEQVLHAFAAGLGSRVAPMYAGVTALAQPADLTTAIALAKAIDEVLPQQRTSMRATERKTRSSTNPFNGTCHYCGKTGHKQRDCPRRAREQPNRAPGRARRHAAVPPPSAAAKVSRPETAGREFLECVEHAFDEDAGILHAQGLSMRLMESIRRVLELRSGKWHLRVLTQAAHGSC